jgi:hypothetical protein
MCEHIKEFKINHPEFNLWSRALYSKEFYLELELEFSDQSLLDLYLTDTRNIQVVANKISTDVELIEYTQLNAIPMPTFEILENTSKEGKLLLDIDRIPNWIPKSS